MAQRDLAFGILSAFSNADRISAGSNADTKIFALLRELGIRIYSAR